MLWCATLASECSAFVGDALTCLRAHFSFVHETATAANVLCTAATPLTTLFHARLRARVGQGYQDWLRVMSVSMCRPFAEGSGILLFSVLPQLQRCTRGPRGPHVPRGPAGRPSVHRVARGGQQGVYDWASGLGVQRLRCTALGRLMYP
jgi:hypothetical protein